MSAVDATISSYSVSDVQTYRATKWIEYHWKITIIDEFECFKMKFLLIFKFLEIPRNSSSQLHVYKLEITNGFDTHAHAHTQRSGIFFSTHRPIFMVQIPSNGMGLQISKIYNVALYMVHRTFKTGDSWRLCNRVCVSHFAYIFVMHEVWTHWALNAQRCSLEVRSTYVWYSGRLT